MVNYLHTVTRSWHQRCPVLQCWDTAHRTVDLPCPGRYRGDTGHTAPAPRCRTSPHHSLLRRTAQVSTDWILSVAPHYDRRTGHQHDTSWHEARLTALSLSEDLSRAAGLGTLRYSGRFLGHLILRPRELDVELLFVDRLPESPHSALQLLLHLLPHTVQVTWVWGKKWPLINSIKEYYKILIMSLVFL